MKALWTGKTARQELLDNLAVNAQANQTTVAEALESCLDGADTSPDGSIKRESLRYWEGLDWKAQARLLSEVRAKVRADDRLMGQKLKR